MKIQKNEKVESILDELEIIDTKISFLMKIVEGETWNQLFYARTALQSATKLLERTLSYKRNEH